ncbi:putative ribosomal protein L35A [Helianthus annuus]|nr:putative ribosomal protein L35A [Helianthus annuus]
MVKGRQGERVRLYTRGTVLGYKRSKSNQYPNTSLVQIEGVNTKEEVSWYQGKRMAYIYKAKVKKNGSHYRCIWGKVTRPHGNTGVVRAKFKSNLPPKSMLGLGFSCTQATSKHREVKGTYHCWCFTTILCYLFFWFDGVFDEQCSMYLLFFKWI